MKMPLLWIKKAVHAVKSNARVLIPKKAEFLRFVPKVLLVMVFAT